MGRRKWMQNIVAAALCLAILFWAMPAYATGLDLTSKAAVLVDGASGDILYQENADLQCYPASVTKIMTLVLALEAVERGEASLEDQVVTSELAASMGGSQVYLYTGETRSLDEMLIAVSVGSGNDASVAVAEHIGGSLEQFVERMNQRAQELGMTGTHFVNPHGLHDAEHYTTAGDLAILAYHAIQVPKFLEYTSIYEYDFRPDPKPLKLWNTNRLLKWYEGTDGMKTGFTTEAGYNLVATVERDGLRLISVVLGVPVAKGHFTESMKLLNYGFNNYSYEQLYSAGDDITTCPVKKGKVDSVPIEVAEDIGMLQQKGAQSEFTVEYDMSQSLSAPLAKGDKAGELILLRDGTEICRYDLVTAEAVEKAGLGQIFVKLFNSMGIMI